MISALLMRIGSSAPSLCSSFYSKQCNVIAGEQKLYTRYYNTRINSILLVYICHLSGKPARKDTRALSHNSCNIRAVL